MHAVWSPGTKAALVRLGLNLLTSNVSGRATSIGEPVGPVVASALGARGTG